jgi:hypothetical protein
MEQQRKSERGKNPFGPRIAVRHWLLVVESAPTAHPGQTTGASCKTPPKKRPPALVVLVGFSAKASRCRVFLGNEKNPYQEIIPCNREG